MLEKTRVLGNPDLAPRDWKKTLGNAKSIRSFIAQNGAWIALFTLATALTIFTQGDFLSSRNLTNLMRQLAINGILASGMTAVILTGGIDLSIGSIVALAGIIVGVTQVSLGWSEFGLVGALGSAAAGAFAGFLCGVWNGGLISVLRIPPFVITLGTMVIARGLALIVSGGSGISPMGEPLRLLGEGYAGVTTTVIAGSLLLVSLLFSMRHRWSMIVFPLAAFGIFLNAFLNYKGLPLPVLFLFVILVAMSLLLRYTVFGRSLFAIGSNEKAAFWAGVQVQKSKWMVYALMGALSGVAAVLLTSRLNSAVPTAGNLFELDAIAAVVIGGTSLRGGMGTVLGTFIGALTIATLNNGMDLLQVSSFYQMVFKGLIIIVAVALDKNQRASFR